MILTVFISAVVSSCALRFFIFSDRLAKHFEALNAVALVFTLVQIVARVSLKFFLDSNEIFLCMRADLSTWAWLNKFLNALPIFAVDFQSYQ